MLIISETTLSLYPLTHSCEYVPGHIGNKRALLKHEGSESEKPLRWAVDVAGPIHHLVDVLHQLRQRVALRTEGKERKLNSDRESREDTCRKIEERGGGRESKELTPQTHKLSQQ